MTRTLLVTLLLALLAAPVALAQPHGPPPGYTDPNAYAIDHAEQQAAQAQADPVGYATSRDPAAEAEHALWFACWEAYHAAGHALDPACAAYFTAPVSVQPHVEGATAEVTEVLNGTGALALADETLDAVNDTLADPKGAVQQVERIVGAAIRFVKDLLTFAKDTLTALGLGVAAGLLGAVEGLLDLGAMPVRGLEVALSGLLSTVSLAGGAMATAPSTVADGVAGAALAAVHGVAAAASAVAGSVAATLSAVGSGVSDAAHGVADGVLQAADAVRDGIADAVQKVGELFDGKAKRADAVDGGLPETPTTGTDADGLLDRLLGSL